MSAAAAREPAGEAVTSPLAATPVRDILVIRVARIGDTMLVTPALRALAAYWPQARIEVAAHPKRYRVLEHLPFVARARALSKRSAPFRGWLRRGARYDLALVYGEDAALVRYARRVARVLAAFRQPDPRLDRLLDVVAERPAFRSDHAVRLALALPGALGVPPAGERLSYVVTEAERRIARARLAADLPARAAPRIALQIASFPTKAYRDWPLESFLALCRCVRARWPAAHFLVLGGRDERARTATLAAALGASATHYAGRLGLRETAALIAEADLYVGVDTGPTHIASALEVPLVAIYHAVSPSGLIGALGRARYHPVDHPAAGGEADETAPMSAITVERVWQAVVAALAEAGF